jgi:hypothetical protein
MSAGGARFKVLPVGARGRRMSRGVNGGLKGGAADRLLRSGQPVVDPEPGTTGFDQAGPPQVRKMPRDGRLGEPERLVEVADTHFPSRE